MPHADTEAMQKHVDEISLAVAPGAHVLIILDKAAWHTKLKLPDNLTLVPQPPACPELNAAESIWQYLRQTFLSNRVFETTAILDASQNARRGLLNQLGRIASIASRDWALIPTSGIGFVLTMSFARKPIAGGRRDPGHLGQFEGR